MERAKLISELTQLDRRESRKSGHNPYALSHYFRAAEDCMEAIAAGASAADAFAANFNPTRGMVTVARNCGLPLYVERGRWRNSDTERANRFDTDYEDRCASACGL